MSIVYLRHGFHHFFNFFKSIAIIICLSLSIIQSVTAQQVVEVTAFEDGLRLDQKFEVFHDPTSSMSVEQIQQTYQQGKFQNLETMDSTGLKAGSIWSHFYLKNTESRDIKLHVEYIDHQLIALSAFEKVASVKKVPANIAELALYNPFDQREIPHNRFVFEIDLPANETMEYFVKFSSDGMGFTFPNLRIWNPAELRKTQTIETSTLTFMLGGFLLMSVFALVGGIATGEKFFYTYSVYSLAKIAAWSTILGYTHQFFITDSFHWSYMSMTGAVSIFCGLLFARSFLQTRDYVRKLDYVLLFMMANTVFLFVCAIFKLTTFSIISITIALLLYPVLSIAGIVRWLQGSREAAVFALAWSFLVFGLVIQALRDLGFVEHNFFNYYWPTFASYTEMVVIMAAMGLKVRRLRKLKDDAEHKYTHHLERSKAELERLVLERTKDLENEKQKAQLDACTDSLTGTRNRRSFFAESEKLMKKTKSSDISFSLLMFDIDNFKQINDTYGHAIGDEALRSFATIVSDKIRDNDIFGRLGGEEFSLLLCGSKEDALQTAERLRNDISNLEINTPKGPLHFTTSIGVAHLTSETMIEELLSLADKALYEAKLQGRNKVIDCETLVNS